MSSEVATPTPTSLRLASKWSIEMNVELFVGDKLGRLVLAMQLLHSLERVPLSAHTLALTVTAGMIRSASLGKIAMLTVS